MSSIKAIETVYNGYRFRSRLEARHAVFFDTLGIGYDYEVDSYDLDGEWYIPDFLLTDSDCYIEIKGQPPTEEELRKAYKLAQKSEKPVFIFHGSISIPNDTRGNWGLARDTDFQGAIGFIPLKEPFDSEIGCDNTYVWSECDDCGSIQIRAASSYCLIPWCCQSEGAARINTPRLIAAYTAARQARFEHGEKGIHP